ncbi:MAG: hypothetical protein ACM3S1_09650, partial [Hyphomicrobiales bacterium]
MKFVSLTEAVRVVQPGNRVYLHGGAATPHALVDALVERASELRGVEIVSLHTDGPARFAEPGMEDHFRHNALFIGANTRAAVQEG